MALAIPASLHTEHDALHATLVRATREPGAVGEAAREVARRLHPHFVKEEDVAMPLLGLLADVAAGRDVPERSAALALASRLEAELPEMLAEHRSIVEALDALREALRDAPGAPDAARYEAFADALALHATTEEDVLYPAAVLVGRHLAARGASGPGS
jgi:hypothetical protein